MASAGQGAEIEAAGDPMKFIKQGGAMIKKGDLESAEVLMLNALETGAAQGNARAVIYARTFLDIIYTRKGEWKEALENLENLAALRVTDPAEAGALYLKAGDISIRISSFERAVDFYSRAGEAFDEAGDDSRNDYIQGSIALAYGGMGEYSKSEEIYKGLLGQKTAAGDATGTILLSINLGDLNRARSEYETALDFYASALDVAEESGVSRYNVTILNAVSLTQQYRGDLDAARAALDEAFEIAGGSDAPRDLAACHHQRGILLVHDGEINAAVESFKKAAEIKREIGDPTLGNTLAEIGRAFFFRGDYKPARRYYRDSINAGLPADVEITVNNNLAMVFKMQGMLEYALEIFEESLDRARSLGLRYQTSFLLNNIGVVLRDLGRLEEALEKHREALEIDRDAGAKLDGLVDINNIALVLRTQGNTGEARSMLEEALPDARAIGSCDDLMRTIINLADACRLDEDYDAAIGYYDEAAALAEKTMNRERRWNALYGAGVAHAKNGDRETAIEKLEKAVGIIETLRADIGGTGDEKSWFLADKVKVFVELIELLFIENRPGEALDYLERMKSRSLLDMIQMGHARIDRGLSEDEIAGETELEIKLAAATREMGKALAEYGIDSPQGRDAGAAVGEARRELNDYRDRLYMEHPRLAFARGENRPVSAGEAAGYLADDEVVVAYMLGEDTSYAWTLTAVGAKMYDLGESAKKINFMVDKKLREALEKGVWHSSQRRSAGKLYDILIKPLENDLEGKKNVGILPDGRLYELPFDVLIDSDDRYLVDRFNIFYTPSLSVMVEARKTKASLDTEDKILAFGNPDFSGAGLAELPGTEEEVKSIAETYAGDATVYLRGEALEERVKKYSSGFSTIHLATHGLLNNNNPLYSSIALSQSGGQEEDGYLQAREIAGIELDAGLVVMSACESGRGRLRAGEGILGLGRSFFSAGVPGIIASLWEVNDRATSFMMRRFYENMKSMQRSEALRRAKIETRDEFGDNPNLWAPFIFMGYGIEGSLPEE